MKLIDKADVVAEIERIKNTEYNENSINDDVACCALDMVIDAINTFEVKEVDLKKEIESYFKGFGKFPSVGIDDCIDIAKHFFELGIKLKGEKKIV